MFKSSKTTFEMGAVSIILNNQYELIHVSREDEDEEEKYFIKKDKDSILVWINGITHAEIYRVC